MNPFKRAWLFNKRNPKRFLGFFIITFGMGILVSVAIIAQQGIQLVELNVKQQVPPFILINLDYNLSASFNERNELTHYEVNSFLEQSLLPYLLNSPYPHTIHRTNSNVLVFFDIEDYLPLENPENSFPFPSLRTIGSSRAVPPIFQSGQARLLGNGRLFTEEEILGTWKGDSIPALISRPVAELNNLTIGSQFNQWHLYNNPELNVYSNWSPAERELLSTLTAKYEVIGIYEVDYELFISQSSAQFSNTAFALNSVIVPLPHILNFENQLFEVFEKIWGGERLPIPPNPVAMLVVLDNPLDLEGFIDSLQTVLPEGFRIQDLLGLYKIPLRAISNVSLIFEQSLFALIALILLSVGIFVTFNLSERRHEFGILIALGERKIKIVLQVCLEVLLSSLLAFTAALFIGNLFADTITSQLLYFQLADHDLEAALFNLGLSLPLNIGLPVRDVDIELADIRLRFQAIVNFYAIGLSAVLAATLLSLFHTFKQNMKKLLL